MPSAGDSSVPSSSVIFWVALWVAKQYHGSPRVAGPAVAAHGPPVEHHEVTGRHLGDALAHGLDDPGRLVAEQERELVVDPALAVVQVGVADPARLHLHDRLARPRVGHVDGHDLDGRPLRAGDDGLDLLHAFSSVDCVRSIQTGHPTWAGPDSGADPLHRHRGVGGEVEGGGGAAAGDHLGAERGDHGAVVGAQGGAGDADADARAVARSSARTRSREFAATPPPIRMWSMPSATAASTALRVSTSQTASWKEAATSATGTGSPESSRACTHRATAVFSPEKEKS